MENYNNEDVLAQYFDYMKSEEATVVFIVKNLIADVDTNRKWIDVVSFDSYGTRGDKIAFNYIVIELFDRKMFPKYPKGAETRLKKAITWKTAHEDIAKQRTIGVKGIKFLITCKLFDKNRGKKETRLLPYWNEEYGGFDYTGRVTTTTIAKQFNLEPKWSYKITGVRKISDNQFKFIRKNYDSKIYPRISKGKFVKINWFLDK